MRICVLTLAVFPLFLVLPGCSSLSLENANFSWPVESVLAVNSMNMIEEGRYALVVSVAPLAAAEFGDSTALRGTTLRIIRNAQGYYFVTGPRFKHVYVFRTGEGALVGASVIEVSPTGLVTPAFNQRPPFIELLDGSAPPRYLTSSDFSQENKR